MDSAFSVCENVQKAEITPELDGVRADAAAAELFGISRSAAERLIQAGAITLDKDSGENETLQKKRIMRQGEALLAAIPEPEPAEAEPEDIPLDIVYEDRDIIVINKPQGMVVHPAPGHTSGTLVSALLYHCKGELSGIGGVMRPGIVHRIDMDTSGLIAVAKNDAAHTGLAAQLEDHSMHREYRAIVVGGFRDDLGTVDLPIARHPTDRKKMAVVKTGGRNAVTHYSVDERFTGFSTLKLRLETGRTHQIRVHMSHMGHPVLGDPVYGGDKTQFQKKHPALFAGQCLHAERLTLIHPITGETMTFEAALPERFGEIMRLLRMV
ncbi:MAG: RluA family pseudouridine synthase [Ruminococcaceae bacterium]|nr:RluA family pseudouridine synthase [Oscillospiraceae bacterium]